MERSAMTDVSLRTLRSFATFAVKFNRRGRSDSTVISLHFIPAFVLLAYDCVSVIRRFQFPLSRILSVCKK